MGSSVQQNIVIHFALRICTLMNMYHFCFLETTSTTTPTTTTPTTTGIILLYMHPLCVSHRVPPFK